MATGKTVYVEVQVLIAEETLVFRSNLVSDSSYFAIVNTARHPFSCIDRFTYSKKMKKKRTLRLSLMIAKFGTNELFIIEIKDRKYEA